MPLFLCFHCNSGSTMWRCFSLSVRLSVCLSVLSTLLILHVQSVVSIRNSMLEVEPSILVVLPPKRLWENKTTELLLLLHKNWKTSAAYQLPSRNLFSESTELTTFEIMPCFCHRAITACINLFWEQLVPARMMLLCVDSTMSVSIAYTRNWHTQPSVCVQQGFACSCRGLLIDCLCLN